MPWFGTRLRRAAVAICVTVIVPVIALCLGVADLLALARRRRIRRHASELDAPAGASASLIVLNWNGRHLLARGMPSVLAAAREGDEVIVVDNGSTDDSVPFVRANFPSVRLIELPSNLGFSGGNNVGVRAANNDIVVLLNSDMVVEPDFLTPLVEALQTPDIFAASAQIFRLDPTQPRNETGRTGAQFMRGSFQLAHLPVEPQAGEAEATLWAGGGSTAYDRRKFLMLGGFDELYSPAYVEDLALSYAAWKRGWSSVFVPKSRVHHEHRGTSRRVFGDDYVDRLISRNKLLFTWRNVQWKFLARHFVWLPADAARMAIEDSLPGTLEMLGSALLRLPQVVAARANDVEQRMLSDEEVLAQSARAQSR